MGQHNSKTSKSDFMETYTYSNFPIEELPDDVLVEVFIRVPGADLATSCSRVSKRWYDLLKTQRLWKEKCIRVYHFPCDTLAALSKVLHADFKAIFFKNSYNRNLIQNPDASAVFNGWEIFENGGNRFAVEREPVGSNSISDYAGPKCEGKTIGCWVTSYGNCHKGQTIDLIKEGCSVEVLDEVRPNINISEWYAARFDCGIQYKLHVKLLKNKDDIDPLHEYIFEDVKPAGRDWFNIEYTFSNYKPGVRYIQYTHGGKDTQFWAGHFGVKFTLSSVQFDLKHTFGPVKH